MHLRIDDYPLPLALVRLSDGKVVHLNDQAREAWQRDGGDLENVLGLTVQSGGGEQELLSALCALKLGEVRSWTLQPLRAGQPRRDIQLFGRLLSGQRAALAGCDMSSCAGQEQDLKRDARRLRALIEANFDAFYDWHIDGGYHEWSPQMDLLLELPTGQSFPQVLDAWVERLHPDEVERVVDRLKQSIQEATAYVDEYQLRTDSGSYRLVSDRGLVLRDEQGEVTDLVGVMRDITQERRARVALEESESLYRTLFEAEINPAVRTDTEGRLLDANDAALAFLSIPRKDIRQFRITDLLGEGAQAALEALREHDGEAKRDSLSLEATTKTLVSPRILRMSVVPCAFEGSITYFWLGTDVTDLLSATEALRDSQASLQGLARALEERAIALRVIVEQGRQERADLVESVRSNLERLLEPMLERLSRALSGRPESAYVDIVRETVRDLAAALSDERSTVPEESPSLTIREREVVQLIRQGKTTAQIAETLHLSAAAVSFHRKNVRRKLGLSGRGQTLRSFYYQE